MESQYLKYFQAIISERTQHYTPLNTREANAYDEFGYEFGEQEHDTIQHDIAEDLIRHLTGTNRILSRMDDAQETTVHATNEPEQITSNGLTLYVSSLNGNSPTGIRRYELPFSGDSTGAFANILTTIFSGILTNFRAHEPDDVALPLTEESFKKLEEMKYAEFQDTNKSDKCTICQEQFEPTTNIKILPCRHIFHIECIGEWLKNYHYKCPLCRKECGEHAASV